MNVGGVGGWDAAGAAAEASSGECLGGDRLRSCDCERVLWVACFEGGLRRDVRGCELRTLTACWSRCCTFWSGRVLTAGQNLKRLDLSMWVWESACFTVRSGRSGAELAGATRGNALRGAAGDGHRGSAVLSKAARGGAVFGGSARARQGRAARQGRLLVVSVDCGVGVLGQFLSDDCACRRVGPAYITSIGTCCLGR